METSKHFLLHSPDLSRLLKDLGSHTFGEQVDIAEIDISQKICDWHKVNDQIYGSSWNQKGPAITYLSEIPVRIGRLTQPNLYSVY